MEDFAPAYLQDADTDSVTRSFHLSYYVHLVIDNEWAHRVYRPKRSQYQAQFAADSDFIWQFKLDWYDLDQLYLEEHHDSRAFRIFASIEDFHDDTLTHYPEDAYNRQIRYITRFYQTFDGDLDHEYPYLAKQEMDDFVHAAAESIEKDLADNGFITI
jgi:hypothetical protein